MGQESIRKLFSEPCSRPLIMGILNLTPDSFSDGGQYNRLDAFVAQAEQMLEQGVDIIDIGGESSRPFASPVTLEEELRRVLPPLSALRRLAPDITISVDTVKAELARQALLAGADIINDISALSADPGMLALAQRCNCPLVIMHRKGSPANMQVNPQYEDVVAEVTGFLARRVEELAAEGIARERIIIDPGIGFGKLPEHNMSLIRELDRFKKINQPLLIGLSRKSFIGALLNDSQAASQRDTASAVLAAFCMQRGANIIRTHNVAATRQALIMAESFR